jgi:hypothetical protein
MQPGFDLGIEVPYDRLISLLIDQSVSSGDGS